MGDLHEVRFGVHSGQQYATFDDCLRLWLRAEELGYDWVSCFDHLRPPLGGPDGPCLEGTTLLAGLAARTSRVRCGFLVAATTWRHPAMLAAAAATIDHICGGRLELGLGAGGPDLGYAQYGIPYPATGERLDRLAEACQVIRLLWRGEPVSFAGRYFRLDGAVLNPLPVQSPMPLLIGGGGTRRTLRIVAEHADTWNTLGGDLDRYRTQLDALAGHCADVGRSPEAIRRSITFRATLAPTAAEAAERRRERLATMPADSPDLHEFVTFGTPEQCVEDLLPYARLGVRDFLLGSRPPLDWQTIELFAAEVVPELRRALGS